HTICRSSDCRCRAFSSSRPSQSTLLSSNHTPPPQLYTLSLHDALPISAAVVLGAGAGVATGVTSRNEATTISAGRWACFSPASRSEEHTSELQSRGQLVCRLLLGKKKAGR